MRPWYYFGRSVIFGNTNVWQNSILLTQILPVSTRGIVDVVLSVTEYWLDAPPKKKTVIRHLVY